MVVYKFMLAQRLIVPTVKKTQEIYLKSEEHFFRGQQVLRAPIAKVLGTLGMQFTSLGR